jgi:hypothetical protein
MMTETVGAVGRDFERELRRPGFVKGMTGNFLILLISPCLHKTPRKTTESQLGI